MFLLSSEASVSLTDRGCFFIQLPGRFVGLSEDFTEELRTNNAGGNYTDTAITLQG
jgi:hypothetical protein